MYTSMITKADKATLQEDGSMFLDVEFVIKNDGEDIDIKRLSFPLDTSSDDIVAEIEKYTQNYGAERDMMAANTERDAGYAKADATIEEIIGKEITVE